MKKIIIALLVIVGIIVVAIGGVGYYVFNKARAFLAPIQQYAALDKNVTNTTSYVPPSNGGSPISSQQRHRDSGRRRAESRGRQARRRQHRRHRDHPTHH
jgi:hypothetical protein